MSKCVFPQNIVLRLYMDCVCDCAQSTCVKIRPDKAKCQLF